MGPYDMHTCFHIPEPGAVRYLCVVLIVCTASCAWPVTSHAQWPPDVEAAGRGGAAGALAGHLSPLRPAQLPHEGSGVGLARTVPLGVGALAASSVTAWHARRNWTLSAALDAQSFDAWSALRPHASLSLHPPGGSRRVRLGATVGLERQQLGKLGAQSIPLVVFGARARLTDHVHLSAHSINSRSAARQGARASAQLSISCSGCTVVGHAAWTLHPYEGSLFAGGGQWILSRWMSIGMGIQSAPLALGFSLRIAAGATMLLAADLAMLSHHNTASTRAVSLRAGIRDREAERPPRQP